jgi:UTP--glucose-1-phosphate uridylyltransferase
MWDDDAVNDHERVEVAVIPCAGAGTRMRPASRVVPKPLLTVVDRPVIQYVVEEAIAGGVSEVVFVVDGRPGDPILAHFVDEPPLPGTDGIRFVSVVQPEPAGLGDAVLRAADAVGGRPFLCMLSDMIPRRGSGFADRLISAYDGRPVVALRRVGTEMADRYGFVSVKATIDAHTVEVDGAVEKPGPGMAPSDLALLGRYVFPSSVFDALSALSAGHGGEIQLTDAIDRLAADGGALGVDVGDTLLDTGTPAGMLEATVVVAMARPDLAPALRETLRLLDET